MHFRYGRISSLLFVIYACVALTTASFSSAAQAGVSSWNQNKYASLVVDGSTGAVIRQQNAGKLRHPASLTKLMTLYVTFLAIDKNKLRMNERFTVSRHAAARPPSKLYLKAGSTIAVRDLINALAIKSANDAAAVLAEGISGSEPEFAKLMTKVASHLGMKKTQFRNASGLHHPAQVTTAYDMARLAIAMKRDFPQYYHIFKKNSFTYKGKTYSSHNNVVKNNAWADGLKTGYINASGFNLVTSAYKNNKRLIGVVMGGNTAGERDAFMVSMLNKAFGSSSLASNGQRINVSRNAAAAMSGGVTPKAVLKPGSSYALASAQTADDEPNVTVKLKPNIKKAAKPIQVASAAPVPVRAKPQRVAQHYRAAVTVLEHEESGKVSKRTETYPVQASPFVTPAGPKEVAAYYDRAKSSQSNTNSFGFKPY